MSPRAGARTAPRRTQPRSTKPSLRLERSLHREGFRLVAGMDEVGRGALAGPVSVGVVVVDESCPSAPVGLRDSKLVPPPRRRALVAPVRRWAIAWGVGHAGADEIDAHGIMACLRLAGLRALAAAGVRPDLVVLDGNHDWLTDPRREGLLGLVDADTEPEVPVRTVIKGDMRCSSVAGASVLAKVERDDLMVALHERHPAYGWNVNKGYAAPDHREALLARGACELHRRSWNLLVAPEPDPAEGPEAAPEGAEPARDGRDRVPTRRTGARVVTPDELGLELAYAGDGS
ncbi:ribonuclease HII [Agilicoccus flavus]|uniref:ribonuclease HII n=1 Tax=Agilicoccus flavus TaxID=2775968 RepID=UPI001CF609B8|nr:ribonuclease HII [Agilicoccus flavus]